jgi:hypothetical protein
MKNMRLINEINLTLFRDDADGSYGVTHKDTHCANESFNAFWDGIGIFHDVFEHWFEFRHKYFTGDYAVNRGGECAATGAAWYFYNTLGVHNRPLSNLHFFGDSIRKENESAIIEAVEYGYTNFGSELLSAVPTQKPLDNIELEYQVSQLWKNVKDCQVCESPDEMEGAMQYKKSLSKSKIANLYRWGYRMAEKMIPDNMENQNVLTDFIRFWDTFCKNNSAEELCNYFRELNIKIYKNSKGEISWKAKLISGDYNVNDYKVTSTHSIEIYELLED